MLSSEAVVRDARDGLRAFSRRPGFTAVAVLSLAIGIGANTAIFSLVNAIILRPVPIERPEELVNLYMHSPSFRFGMLSYPDFEDVRDGTTEVFSEIGGVQFSPVQVEGGSGVNIVFAEAVTGSYFPMLGFRCWPRSPSRWSRPASSSSRAGSQTGAITSGSPNGRACATSSAGTRKTATNRSHVSSRPGRSWRFRRSAF